MKRVYLAVASLLVATSAVAAETGRADFYSGLGVIVGYSDACGFKVDEGKLTAAMDEKFPPKPEDLPQLSAYISMAKRKAEKLEGLTKTTECHAAAQAAASIGALAQ